MKVYVTARFKGSNQASIKGLCTAVRASGMEDFSFIRDIENYQKVFNDPKELWQRAKAEIAKCDALLIDVSDAPSGGRVIEAGIAYGLGLPIFVIVKSGTDYKKDVYNGIAAKVIEYNDYHNVTEVLKDYLID